MKSEKILLLPKWVRALLIVLALLLLATMYLFQRFNFLHFLISHFITASGSLHPYFYFIFNKTLRLIVNDVCCFLLIFALFEKQNYLRVAFWVFLFEFLILLPVYFILKLWLEGDAEISSPLLSQLHRLIINPTLMILLLIAFFYQRFKAEKNT